MTQSAASAVADIRPESLDAVLAQMANGGLAGAMMRIHAALEKQPHQLAWLMCAGSCARLLKNWGQAEQFFLRLTALAPKHFDAWCQLAQVLRLQNKPLQALQAYLQALALQPQSAHVHYSMAGLLKQLGRPEAAQAAYLQALQLQPEHPQASAELGLLWQEQGRYDAAEKSYALAVKLAPQDPLLAYNHAVVLQHLQRHEQALASYQRALALRPDFEEASGNLGGLLVTVGRVEEAKQHLLALVRARPDSASAYINLGNAWQAQSRFEEAEAAFRRALALDDSATAHYNLGNLLARLQRFEEAEQHLGLALVSSPRSDALMAWNLSLLLLRLGRYGEAWALHESRHGPDWPRDHPRVTHPPDLNYPAWRGESLEGRRILLLQEQGGGDQIQFVRYLPLLLAKGPAHITLLCPEPLRPLFKQFESDRVSVRTVSTLAELPEHDCWVFIMSLPLYLGTDSLANIPAATPYLHPDPERVRAWRPWLPTARRRIGLVWKGSAGHRNDHHRSLPHLSALAPLWSVPQTTFVSLQKGQAEDQALAPPAGQPLVHLGTQIKDFADSAAIVSQLDLLIGVDTAAVHLAGALGVPCWVLLPSERTDWRWLLKREDTPWYPSLRLFRQGEQESWAEVIERVTMALADRSYGCQSLSGTCRAA
jgi:tetratricopeptide (TPR) repeat protein